MAIGKGKYGFYEKVKPLTADPTKISETYYKTSLALEANKRADEELKLKKEALSQKKKKENAVGWKDFADKFDVYPANLALTVENLNARAGDLALDAWERAERGEISKGEYRKLLTDIENSVRSWDNITRQGNEYLATISNYDPLKYAAGEVVAEQERYVGLFEQSTNITLSDDGKLVYNNKDGTTSSGMEHLAKIQPKNLREARINQFLEIEENANIDQFVGLDANGFPYVRETTEEQFLIDIKTDSKNVSSGRFGDLYNQMVMWNEQDIKGASKGEVKDAGKEAITRTDNQLISIYENKIDAYMIDKTPKPITKTDKDIKLTYKPISEVNTTFDSKGNAIILVSREDVKTKSPIESTDGYVVIIKDGVATRKESSIKPVTTVGAIKQIRQAKDENGNTRWYVKYSGSNTFSIDDLKDISEHGLAGIDSSKLSNIWVELTDGNGGTKKELDQLIHFLDYVNEGQEEVVNKGKVVQSGTGIYDNIKGNVKD